MQIVVDDLSSDAIAALLNEHLQDMFRHSPPESVHALDLDALRAPDVTFWSVWEADTLLGCGALKQLDERSGEIKSMRTATAHLGRGVATAVLNFIMSEARQREYTRLYLETGSNEPFVPALRLYEKHGFQYCEPFADYTLDPFSRYMTIEL